MELTKTEAEIIREASEVLAAVADSGVPLPANWRWPLIDELSGIAAMQEHGANYRSTPK